MSDKSGGQPRIESAGLPALILLGVLARIYAFGDVPPGLNQDEASNGYEAHALLNYGIDRNGFRNPAFLVSFGDAQHALYAYLSIPFVAVFGLNEIAVRAVSLVLGILCLPLFHRFSRTVADESVAWMATFLLAISPWHIMTCRWGHEFSLFPTLFLAGVFLMIRSVERPNCLPFAAMFFALCLYTYAPALMSVPIFLLFSCGYLVFHGKVKLWSGVVAALVFMVVALPSILYVYINYYQLESIRTSFISIPRLPTVPRFVTMTLLSERSLFTELYQNAKTLIQILIGQHDRLIWNAVPFYGICYVFSLPFTLVGVLSLVLRSAWRKRYQDSFFLICWLLAGVALGMCIQSNINRINIILLPLILLTALGIVRSAGWLTSRNGGAVRLVRRLVLALYLLAFAGFARFYFTKYPELIGPAFFESFGEAVRFTAQNTKGPICFTSRVNMPYIFVLFYTQADPHKFLQTVRYENPGGPFQRVASFDRYFFGPQNCSAGPETAFVLHRSEFMGAFRQGDTVREFKHYVAVLPRQSP
jgi:hypothetical protein